MKRQPIKYITGLLSLSLMLLTSCQKNESSSMVGSSHPYYIEAYLESGQTGIVHISVTGDISGSLQGTFLTRDDAIDFYKNLKATVLLLKDNQVVDTLNQLSCQGKDFLICKIEYSLGNTVFGNDTTTRYWYLQGKSHFVEQGGHYKMIVRIPSHPDMVATCIVPQKVSIQKLDTTFCTNVGCIFFPRKLIQGPWSTTTNDSFYYYVPSYIYQLTFTDPSAEQNYYQIEAYYNYRSVTMVNIPYLYYEIQFSNLKFRTITNFFANPMYANKNLNDGFWIANNPLLNDKLFDGNKFTVDVTPTSGFGDSLVYFNLVSMSQGYYERKMSEDLYLENSDNTFASPTEMYSNFSNAVGFLAGRSVSRDSIRLILYDKAP